MLYSQKTWFLCFLLALLFFLFTACTDDEILTPEEEVPFLVAGSINIAGGQKYTDNTTVSVTVAGAGSDSVLVWNGQSAIPDSIAWHPMTEDELTIAEFLLPNQEGPHTVNALFSGEEKGLSEVFSDTIIVDLSAPSAAPAPIYPSDGASGVSSALALSWEPGQDDWCASEDLTYAVYGGLHSPPTDLLYEGPLRYVPVGNIPLVSTYYWQVTVLDNLGHQTTGSVNTFGTWNASVPEFVLAPAGSFIMGSPEDEWERRPVEVQHEVTFTHPFFIATTEFTYGDLVSAMNWAYDNGYVSVDEDASYDISGSEPYLFDQFSESTSRLHFEGGQFVIARWAPERILSWVNWEEAAIICDWLNFQAGLDLLYQRGDDWLCNGGDVYGADGFRLATEAEWEYCCRAGSTTAFANGDISHNACGDVVLNEIGWYCGNYLSFLYLPAQLIPNAWGVYDMHGGTSEWIYDWYGDYPSHPVIDPINVKQDDWRVLRSGMAISPSPNWHMRSACRGRMLPTFMRATCSLRIVRSFGNAGR